MTKLPKFPPDFEEWRPCSPPEGPPIPKWLMENPDPVVPWVKPEELLKVEEMAGRWAGRRAAAMLSKEDIERTMLPRFAKTMYRRMLERYGIPAPPKALGFEELTPEQREKEISLALRRAGVSL